MKVPFLDIQATYKELAPDIDKAVNRVLSSGWYILGPEVEQFEHAFAEYCGVKHCIGLGNGLDALHILLKACGVGPGDEVIVPANTYIATWLAVSQVGARIVPVEPDPATFNLNPELLKAAITPRTRIIMPVHLYGLSAEMDPILEIAAEHNIKVIDDCAQGHGALYKGHKIGQLANASAFSFYPTKNLGCVGDGGAVTTNDDEIADQVRLLRNYGARVKYYNELQGYNSRLDPLQAAVLNVKLNVLEEWNERRRELAKFYLENMRDFPGLKLPLEPAGYKHVWHVFAIRHQRRDDLAHYLNQNGIGTLIHYPVPPHRSQAYAKTPLASVSFPLSEEIALTELSIPMGPHVSREQATEVIKAMQDFEW